MAEPVPPAEVRPDKPFAFGVVGVGVGVGTAPAPSFLGELGLGGRYGLFSASALLRWDAMLGSPKFAGVGVVESSVATLDLLPCVHPKPFELCVRGRAGEFRAALPEVSTQTERALLLAVGARAGFTVPLSDAVDFVPALEGSIPLTRPTIRSSGAAVWSVPWITGAVDLGFRARF